MQRPRLTFRRTPRPDFAPPDGAATRPRLVLHAGSQKTGTTAIQFALSENRDRLASAGVWYPPIDAFFPVDPRLARARAHFAFANAVADFTARDRKRLLRFVAAIHARAGEHDTTILSAESIYRLTARPSPGAAAQTALQRRMRFLERLAMVTAGFDAEILLYLRRVDRYAESIYAESIVKTANTWTFHDFLKSRGDRFAYRAQVDRFKAHFPVRLRNFESAAGSGLLRAFCEEPGLGVTLPDTVERRRPSVPNAAVLWLRRAKCDNPKMAELERNRRWHFALRPENAELFDAGAPSSFWRNRAERDAFIERNQAGVTEIAFPDPGTGIAPRVTWSDARHGEVEQRFRAWQAANRAMLRGRERRRVPPYVLEG